MEDRPAPYRHEEEPDGVEEELKLQVTDPEAFDRIAEAPEVLAHSEGVPRDLEMTADYIDTEDLRLLGAGYAFRVRWEGTGWVATVKADLGQPAEGGFHRHREWEAPVAGPEPDPTVFEDPDLRHALETAQGDRPLRVLFRVAMDRQVRDLRWTNGTRAEWAADRGWILAGRDSLAVREVELERKGGDMEPIHELAELLQQRYPLTPDSRTKFARGLALAGLETRPTGGDP